MAGNLARTVADVFAHPDIGSHIRTALGTAQAEGVLVDGANVSWDVGASPRATVTLAGDRELDNPTNMKAGQVYVLRVVQDATGTRLLTTGTAYKWIGGTDAVLSVAANAVDILVFYCDGTNMNAIIVAKGFAD